MESWQIKTIGSENDRLRLQAAAYEDKRLDLQAEASRFKTQPSKEELNCKWA